MIPSRPLSIGGIIEETIRIVKHTYWRAALLLLVFTLPGFIVMHFGVLDMLDTTEVAVQKFADFSPEAPKLIHDYIFSGKYRRSAYTLLYFQYKVLFTTMDSVGTALNIEYPDSASRAVVKNRLDSTISEYKANPAPHPTWISGHLQFDLIILVIGFLLYMLGVVGSTAAQYDLGARTFEERSLDIPSILKLTLRRTMWFLLVQYVIIVFAMLLGFGMVIGITFAISNVLGVLGMLAAFVIFCYAIFRIFFSGIALVSEELGPFDAIKRSLDLTKGAFWRIAGISIICWLLFATIGTLLRLPFNFIFTPNLDWLIEFVRGNSFDVPRTFQSVRSAMYSFEALIAVSALVTASFSPAFITTFYYDLRTRKEGALEYHEEEENPVITETEEDSPSV